MNISPSLTSSQSQPSIVIIGAGPAGCTLACYLAQRGIACAVFDDEKRPDLLVGESLLPTVVQMLRELGIEDEVKAISQFKPGVSFLHATGENIHFSFPAKERHGLPNYAYNVPRPGFDQILRRRAEELGARFILKRAGVQRGSEGREIELDAESLAAIGGKHPSLLIDATGRARSFARCLEIGSQRGKRNDVAYFAHYEDFATDVDNVGQVVLTVLNAGWSWRIPLRGKLSVGVVVPAQVAQTHGKTAEERLESIIDSEPLLRNAGSQRKRVSEVMTYTNYQLISDRGHGPGWASLGDAFGFVDPMLSPGLFMGMLSAKMFDQALQKSSSLETSALHEPLQVCYEELRDWHAAWKEIIEYFYDGTIFSLNEGGARIRESERSPWLMRKIEAHLTRCITGMVSGAHTRKAYNRKLLRFFANYMMRDVREPAAYAVQNALAIAP
jgi:flavin-dependent dehydrogenase